MLRLLGSVRSLATPWARFSPGARFWLAAFLVPLLVRLLPEVLMGQFVVGFDTLSYYVPVAFRWVHVGAGFFEAFAYAPLFYGLLVGLVRVGVPLTVSLKALPPVLLGLLGLSIYGYARKGLVWSGWKSLSVAFLGTLYFVALRVSWDMLRSELGLVFLFVFLTLVSAGSLKGSLESLGLISAVMVLVVLSHQLVSVVMFVVVLALVVNGLLKRESVHVLRLALGAIPAILVFGLVVYSNFVVSSGFSVVDGFPSVGAGGWFALFGFGSYAGMVAVVLGFVLYCYLPLLPFVWSGFKHVRRVELWAWVAWCLFAVLSMVVSPGMFVPGGYRWTLLLVFPFAFFAVEALSRFRRVAWRKVVGGVLVGLSLCFLVLPAEAAFPFFGVFPYYVPSSMMQNSVSLRDAGDVVDVLSWYTCSVGSDGVLLVHDAFNGWATFFAGNGSRIMCYGYGDSAVAAQGAVERGRDRVFLVWWVSGEGWHGVESLPPCFAEVFRSGHIAVYEYNASVVFPS